jgi:hypothetical protein
MSLCIEDVAFVVAARGGGRGSVRGIFLGRVMEPKGSRERGVFSEALLPSRAARRSAAEWRRGSSSGDY